MNSEGVACIVLGILLPLAMIVEKMRGIHRLYESNEHERGQRSRQ